MSKTDAPGPPGPGHGALPPGQKWTPEGVFPVLHSEAAIPAVDLATYRFTITGRVARPVSLSWAELEALPRVEVVTDFHCVTHWSMRGTRWRGIPFAAIWERAGALPGAAALMWKSVTGYTTNTLLADCLRPGVLLSDQWNGAPLEPRHGAPLRSFVPHLYAWKSTKWVSGFEVLAADAPGYWEARGYHMRGDPFDEERFGH